MVFYVYADLCSLLAATSQFSILIGQNLQLTGCRNGNEMRNATCADTQISIEWPYCSFLYCVSGQALLLSICYCFPTDCVIFSLARNLYAWTPLDCAADQGWTKSAKVLIEYDAPIDPIDKARVGIDTDKPIFA